MPKNIVIISLFLILASGVTGQQKGFYCHGEGYKGYVFGVNYGTRHSIKNQKFRTDLSLQDIVTAESILKSQLTAINTSKYSQGGSCPDIGLNLNKYFRQYFGFINKNGEKIVVISFFWEKGMVSENELSEEKSVDDGCSYYWNVEVNLTQRKLENLYVNGVG
jgi:hypothetical protein